ncbi:tryptophan synthase alpha chain [Mangrovibacterium marinum]|uniref:Tryptophan synthase alpha chain n=1 Tax=Mangrovibacterium marinum TaxID=1639118 RepID=A0A2T5C0Z8_9BACT|nr:tryptophan synthase subunit alpha [Mangrovibacterium marinum]PTN08291.1 tryptophan synthase alpha chain [Mangrovibacterium marinum]
MKNRINQLFHDKKENILSVYFTAGYPQLDDTVTIIEQLVANGVDLIEIGMPFSDPVADGPVIQQSSLVALKNGMCIARLFEQLKGIREKVNIPLILMGYLNPVLQYGVEAFCQKCAEVGIDGLILPDLPLEEYHDSYREIFARHNLHNILLITPQTSEKRLHEIDEASHGFIYMVSSSSTTGVKSSVADFHLDYFERINQLKLQNPRLIGFGISNKETFDNACQYAQGAIIGSAFVKALGDNGSLDEKISKFVNQLVKGV